MDFVIGMALGAALVLAGTLFPMILDSTWMLRQTNRMLDAIDRLSDRLKK